MIPQQFLSLESRKKLYYFFQKRIKKFFFLIRKNFNKKFFFHYFIFMFRRMKSLFFQTDLFKPINTFNWISYFFFNTDFDSLWKSSKRSQFLLKKQEKNNWLSFLKLIQIYLFRLDFFLSKIFSFLSISQVRFLINSSYFFINGKILNHIQFFLSNFDFIEVHNGLENTFSQWSIFSLRLHFNRLLNFSHYNYVFVKKIYYEKLFFFIKKWIYNSLNINFLLFNESYKFYIFQEWNVQFSYKWKSLDFFKDFNFFKTDDTHSIFKELFSFLYHYYSFLKRSFPQKDYDSLIQIYEQTSFDFLMKYQQLNQLKWSYLRRIKLKNSFLFLNVCIFFSQSLYELKILNLLVFNNYLSLYFFFFFLKFYFYFFLLIFFFFIFFFFV